MSHLVARFNREGLAALDPRHGGGHTPTYDAAARDRILREAARTPTPEADGTATWSLTLLRRALRAAPDGLPQGLDVHHLAGPPRGRVHVPADPHVVPDRVRRPQAQGRRRDRHRPGRGAEKKLIEDAYTRARRSGWRCGARTRPARSRRSRTPARPGNRRGTRPASRTSTCATARPRCSTLFRPADGRVRIEGATSSPNAVLHPWLKRELAAILAELPTPPPTADASRAAWERWQAGLTAPITLPERVAAAAGAVGAGQLGRAQDPGVRAVAVRPRGDAPVHPAGRVVAEHGREHPTGAQAAGLGRGASDRPRTRSSPGSSAVARHWNAAPTPFVWGGKRAARRKRRTGATARRGGVRSMHPAADPTTLWPRARQVTHY